MTSGLSPQVYSSSRRQLIDKFPEGWQLKLRLVCQSGKHTLFFEMSCRVAVKFPTERATDQYLFFSLIIP